VSTKSKPLSTSWIVRGHALVPVEIEIKVTAPTSSIAGAAAEKIWHSSKAKKGFIIPGSVDEAAVHGFRWSEAEPAP